LEGDRDWAVDRLREIGERGDVEVVSQLATLAALAATAPRRWRT